jgi:methionyl-tRNA formyltransferase
MSRPSAAVFAYSDVGVRCLRALLGAGIDVQLVVTHEDDPKETRWYDSVADVAERYRLHCIAPASGSDPAVLTALTTSPPDFIFSFYYRQLLPEGVLAAARRGALNMHGSLLPHYRGRAPVNWAVLRGETQTGATLHYMVARADAGDIVDQQAVPILSDDTAAEVMRKVTVAAEMVLVRSLPGLLSGTAARCPQTLLSGEYFGRRTAEDGRIDWSQSAAAIHNLVRAVAPPFPGAFTDLPAGRVWIHGTRRVSGTGLPATAAGLFVHGGRCWLRGGDGEVLEVVVAADASGTWPRTDLATRAVASGIASV